MQGDRAQRGELVGNTLMPGRLPRAAAYAPGMPLESVGRELPSALEAFPSSLLDLARAGAVGRQQRGGTQRHRLCRGWPRKGPSKLPALLYGAWEGVSDTRPLCIQTSAILLIVDFCLDF